jgi:hypothetical protein
MKTQMLIKARQLWCVGHADRATQRHNIRAWVRSLRHLGTRWVMAHQERKLPVPVPEGQISSMVLPFTLRTPRRQGETFERWGAV